MKRIFLFVLAVIAFAACTQNGVEEMSSNRAGVPNTISVGFEQSDETRIELNDSQKTVWNEGDCLSVFYRSYSNLKWQYQGKDGERTGTFKKIAGTVGSQTMSSVLVAYPYSESYCVATDDSSLEAILPAEQSYKANSYGKEGTLMVAKSDFTQFTLKSVCGWLRFDLAGNGQAVRSIRLRGNNGEQVAGLVCVDTETAEFTFANELGGFSNEENNVGGGLVFDDTIFTEVVLNCKQGVILGSEATSFYVGLLPQTFTNGATAVIECMDGTTQTISTSEAFTLERNHIIPIIAEVTEGEPVDPSTPEVYTEWGVVGGHQGWDITSPTYMYYTDTEGLYVARDVEITDAGFKFAKHGLENWDDSTTFFGAWEATENKSYFDFSTIGLGTWYNLESYQLEYAQININVEGEPKLYDVYLYIAVVGEYNTNYYSYTIVESGTEVTVPEFTPEYPGVDDLPEGWGIVGAHQNWDITNPELLVATDTENLYVLENVTLVSSGFKFAKPGLADWNIPNSYFGAHSSTVVLEDEEAYFDFTAEMGNGWYEVYNDNLDKHRCNIGVTDWSKSYDIYLYVAERNDDSTITWSEHLMYTIVEHGVEVKLPGNESEPEPEPQPQPGDESVWALRGEYNAWEYDTVMLVTEQSDLFVVKDLYLEAYSSFKVKMVDQWETNYGVYGMNYIKADHYITSLAVDGENIIVEAEGTYDIYFDAAEYAIYVMTAGQDYTKATLQTESGIAPEPEPEPEPEPTPGVESEWSLYCDLDKDDLWSDYYFVTTTRDSIFVIEDVELEAGQAFLIRKPSTEWADKYGASGVNYIKVNHYFTAVLEDGYNFANDIYVESADIYDIYFDAENRYVYLMSADTDYLKAEEQFYSGEEPKIEAGVETNFSIWSDISGTWEDTHFYTTATKNLLVAKNLSFGEGKRFIIHNLDNAEDVWAEKYGAGEINYIKANHYINGVLGGQDVYIEVAGTYDIYFDITNLNIYIMEAGADYSTASLQTENGKEPEPVEPEVTENVLYLQPNANWNQSNARFAAYFFEDGKAEVWVSMTKVEDNIYECYIPDGYTNVIFCRMNPSTTANNWNNKWNQTADLKVPTNDNNLYIVKDGTWDNGGGTWSVK